MDRLSHGLKKTYPALIDVRPCRTKKRYQGWEKSRTPRDGGGILSQLPALHRFSLPCSPVPRPSVCLSRRCETVLRRPPIVQALEALMPSSEKHTPALWLQREHCVVHLKEQRADGVGSVCK